MLALLLTALAAAPAQEPQQHVSLRYGREALEAGRHAEAQRHFLYALARSADPAEVVGLLLRNAAAAGDADARALWAHGWWGEAADARGRAKPGKLKDELPADDPHPQAVAAARAEAVRALAKYGEDMRRSKTVGAAVLGEWAEDLGRQLAAPAAALRAEHGADFTPTIEADRKRMRAVIGALGDLLRANDVGGGDEDFALRAARCIRGLAAQEDFETPYGPPSVDVEPEASAAASALARRRAAQAAAVGGVKVWTVEELEALGPDEARAFTLAHASFSNPGVAASPQGWYRVETNCGHGTLLGAAETVEYHHRRLANWYGQDPFVGRPGVLRVVPESHGLEMEGAPFWWAGGFQGGDVTTLKFTRGTIPELGRGITHELTHRFDGAVYGGLPGWLSEGRAVWTAANYGFIEDEEFVDDHVAFGTMANVLRAGYGDQRNLERLLTGGIEDYRDNYSAGYALFVYLRSWSGVEDGGSLWYAERLESYMKGRERTRGDGLAAFAKAFADGDDGRPDGMEAFAADWRAFLEGFRDHLTRDVEGPRWIARYDAGAPRGEAASLVYDEPTFSWLRARAEPWFGQDQARIGAELLADAGQAQDAVEAYTWALAVDEPSDAVLARFARQAEAAGNADAAWVLRRWERYASPLRDFEEPGPAPMLPRLQAVTLYRDALAAAARDYAASGLPAASAALAADHDRLSYALGLPPLSAAPPVAEAEWAAPPVAGAEGAAPAALPDAAALAKAREALLHPYDAPPRHLDLDGWAESGLTGYEDARVEGLWCIDDAADLHVGRKEPRTGTDTMDRDSPRRDAFVHSLAWQDAGRYRLKTKIELTTALLRGGITVGWTRRDRAVRIRFSAGDWDYAVGEREEREKVGAVNWRISGAYAQDDAVSGNKPFPGDASTFDVEVLVDGPTVELYLDGDLVGNWTALDAHPVQGHVGFFTSTGAMRVIAPTVQRLDRSRWSPGGGAVGFGLHPRLAGETEWRKAIGRPVGGMPLAKSGTLLMWFSEEEADTLREFGADGWRSHVEGSVAEVLEAMAAENPSQGMLVMVPESYPEDARLALAAAHAGALPGGFAVATHARGAALQEDRFSVSGWARVMVAFVDPVGVLRVAQGKPGAFNRLPRIYRDALRTYQDHLRPGQAGARE